MLSIPAELSETGKRQQLFYSTQKEADTAAEQVKTRKRNFGETLTLLSSVRMNEAAEAFSLIDKAPVKTSLLFLVRDGLEKLKQRSASLTLDALFVAYIDAHNGKTLHHTDKLRSCQKRFSGIQGMVSDLSHEDFEPILNSLTPSMRNAQMRLLRAVLNFGCKRQYLASNPLDRLDFADIEPKEVETIPASLVEKMLKDALTNDRDLLPFLVLGFYCGVRPIGELQKVRWSDISLSDKVVTIRKEVSKTRTRRFIDLSENAVAWLTKAERRNPSSLVVPFSFDGLRNKREANWKRVAKRKAWIHQGMRHTFCSNWLAKYHDVNKLLLQTGHTSPQMLWTRYHRGTEKAEAEKFWSILPPEVKKKKKKVIAFPSGQAVGLKPPKMP